MNIEEMKKYEWVISWSGGKDSTATIILCHKYGIPIKKIIYVRMMYDESMPATLPIMTKFVDNAKSIFEEWGYSVEEVKSIKSAQELMNKNYVRSKKYPERNGKPYGITAFARGHCNFTKTKTQTIEKLLCNDDFEMVGYASDEKDRLHRLTETKQSILKTLGVEEVETYGICEEFNLLSPLYGLGFYRDGCWFCPNAGVHQRQYLKDNHPELVEEIHNSITMCDYDISSICKRNNWVKDYYKTKENNQISIFDAFDLSS